MRLIFADAAWEDYLFWQQQEDLVALGEGRGNGSAMLCIVGGYVLAGFNSGSVNRLTHQRYRTAAREVAATFREEGGMPQYIAIPQ